MAIPPVKILPDLIVDGQIIKKDENGVNILVVSGNLASGYVSSSVPIYAPNLTASLTSSYALTAGYAENASSGITQVSSSGNITGSGLSGNEIRLKDNITLTSVTASLSGNLTGIASYATSASYSLTAAYAENATINTGSFVTRSEVTGALTPYATLAGISASFTTPAQVSSSIANFPTRVEVTGVLGNYATTGSNTFNGDQVITGNLEVLGTATVNELHITYITSSIIYTSGSTKFGDTIDDTHQFTGSVLVSGNVTANQFIGTASYVALSLDNLTDVSVATATSGNYLRYNGSNWISEDASILTSSNAVIQPLYHSSGTFSGQETVELQLPTGSGGFPVNDLDRIIYSLVTKETSGDNWRNDLASVEFKVSSSHIYAVISAPSLPYAYSFNALNQNVSSSYTYTQATSSYALTAAYAENAGSNITAAYNNLREIVTGSFDIDGTKTIELQKFSDTDLDFLTFDILTKPSGTNYYTNDLISFQVSGNLSNKISIYVSAPAYGSSDRYKIIAVKEIGSF